MADTDIQEKAEDTDKLNFMDYDDFCTYLVERQEKERLQIQQQVKQRLQQQQQMSPPVQQENPPPCLVFSMTL